MPTNLVPPAIPTFSPASGMVTGPADGDPLVAASVNGAFQPLADRSLQCFEGIKGSRASYGQVVCDDGATLYWSGFQAARTTTRAYGSVQIATTIGALGLGALAANTLYYIYAQAAPPVWNLVGNTTAPDPTRRYMNGNEDLVFVSYFATDSGATVVPWSQWDTEYNFTSPPLLLSLGNAAAYTTISTATLMPSWVELAKFFCRHLNTDTAAQSIASLSKDGTTLGERDIVASRASGVGATFYQQSELTMPIESAVGPKYKVAGGAGQFSVYAVGCYL